MISRDTFHEEKNPSSLALCSREGRRHIPVRHPKPPRMSTPMRRERSSLRTTKRKHEEIGYSSHGRMQVTDQKYRTEFDPYLEIRKARERLSRYKQKGDSNSDEFLSKDSEKDLQRYEEKLKRRYSMQPDFTGVIELERRQQELLRRQRDIDVGKTTEKYAEYILKIPKPQREKCHPRTPNKFRIVSRRAWDGMIKKWRRNMHNFENLNSNDTWCSLASDVSISSNSHCSSPQHESHPIVEHAAGQSDIERLRESMTLATSGTRKETQQQLEHGTDDDTLQEGKKVSPGVPPTAGLIDDETLHSNDTIWNLRGRRVLASISKNESSNDPPPDVIHSGLTNDLNYLGIKRDDLKFETISEMLSPNKRARTSISISEERPLRTSGRKKNIDKKS